MRERQEVQALPRSRGIVAPAARESGAAHERDAEKRPEREPTLTAKLTSEFVGTLIVTLGTIVPAALAVLAPLTSIGTVLSGASPLSRAFSEPPISYAVLAGSTGVATAIVIYALGKVSGAHTNPITTLAFALRRDCSWGHVVPYVVAQFGGAIAAGAVTLAILPLAHDALKTTLSVGPWPAFWLEIVLTAILVLVNLSTANQGRFIGPHSAIANGATTVFDRWISYPISGGSMNPARTLGPAIVAGGTANWWVYTFAPLAGCLIGVALMWLIQGPPTGDEAEKSGE